MSSVLAKICRDKQAHVAERRSTRRLAEVRRNAEEASPPRGFAAALGRAVATGRLGLISEIKRASPSKGLIRKKFHVDDIAQAYARGGAACLSVLTDGPYFMGRDEDLAAARAAVPLPVLRKDFMLDPYQIYESRALGADCVLLIMAAVDDSMATALEDTAMALGMDVLIEVHDEAELDRALALRSPLIGINNRDLTTLETDIATTRRLAPRVPADRVVVSESGLYTRGDLEAMAAIGVRRFLIGESLMRQDDVEGAVRALLAQDAAEGTVA